MDTVLAYLVGAVIFAAMAVATVMLIPILIIDAALALVHLVAHWLRHNVTRPPGDLYVRQYDRLNAWLKRRRQEIAEQEARERQ